MIFNAGLILLVAGWGCQAFVTLRRGNRGIGPWFLGFYGTGVLLLVIGGFTSADIAGGLLNALCLVLVAVTGGALLMKRPKAQ